MAFDKKEYLKNWKLLHPNYNKEWKAKNLEKVKEKEKIRSKTPMGRAHYLLQAYNQKDKLHNRGKGDLTAQWIVENIFSKPCKCGKSGWQIIGCNRIDNSKPHTKDNVEPCCEECNNKLNWESQNKRVDQIDKTSGEVLASFVSVREAVKQLSLKTESLVYACARGKRKTAYDYIWKRPM